MSWTDSPALWGLGFRQPYLSCFYSFLKDAQLVTLAFYLGNLILYRLLIASPLNCGGIVCWQFIIYIVAATKNAPRSIKFVRETAILPVAKSFSSSWNLSVVTAKQNSISPVTSSIWRAKLIFQLPLHYVGRTRFPGALPGLPHKTNRKCMFVEDKRYQRAVGRRATDTFAKHFSVYHADNAFELMNYCLSGNVFYFITFCAFQQILNFLPTHAKYKMQ